MGVRVARVLASPTVRRVIATVIVAAVEVILKERQQHRGQEAASDTRAGVASPSMTHSLGD